MARKCKPLGRKIAPFEVPLETTNAQANFRYDPRQKGLLWYGTYHVDFAGRYRFHNTSTHTENVTFSFPLPATQAQYDDLSISLDGKPLDVWHQDKYVKAQAPVVAGASGELTVHYVSQGLDRWSYSFGESVNQVENFVSGSAPIFKTTISRRIVFRPPLGAIAAAAPISPGSTKTWFPAIRSCW